MTDAVNSPDANLAMHQPATVADIGEVVRQAAESGLAIYPAGGQTQWDLGLPPTHRGILVDTRRLDQVIDYPARDMTITVQAGMTVARLQTLLATESQRLPIDVPCAEQATLGGILATNVSGPRRFGCGTLRDYVIGISVVNDEGHEVKAGGRVVKNVAGYDMLQALRRLGRHTRHHYTSDVQAQANALRPRTVRVPVPRRRSGDLS